MGWILDVRRFSYYHFNFAPVSVASPRPDVRPLAVYWEKFYDSTGGYFFVERLLDKF